MYPNGVNNQLHYTKAKQKKILLDTAANEMVESIKKKRMKVMIEQSEAEITKFVNLGWMKDKLAVMIDVKLADLELEC